MKKYIDAEKLKARLVQTVVTIDQTLEDTAQAWQKGYNIALMNVAGGLDEMPAAYVVEVKHGRWEEHIVNNIYCDGGVAIRLTCPVCGECFTVTRESRPRERFCRWCGAKMDLEEEAEEE